MPAIRLQTEIPGPLSRDLHARRTAAVARGVGNTLPAYIASARGATLTDVDGNVYLDFAGGIGTMNVGHSNREVIAAAQAQLERLQHTAFALAPYEGYVALCEKLNQIAPGSGTAGGLKSVLTNSGAEAIENAVKIARRFTGRAGVVVFDNGFHGRTLLSLTMTSKVAYKQGFGPMASDVHRLPFPYTYRSDRPLDAAACRATFEEFFSGFVAADQVACVVIEPVAGEGGFLVVPTEWMRELAAICAERGVMLVFDEVQTGFGRTGTMFAAEHFGVAPDLTVLAKSMGGGLPISAVVGRAEVMDAAPAGGLGGTFVGNPVACAAALAAIEFIERERLPERARQIGEIVAPRFEALRERFEFVGDARGLGAMRALELVTDKASKAWDKERLQRTIRGAYQRGLLLVAAGNHGNVARTLMPLVITDAELAEGLDVLEAALAAS